MPLSGHTHLGVLEGSSLPGFTSYRDQLVPFFAWKSLLLHQFSPTPMLPSMSACYELGGVKDASHLTFTTTGFRKVL